MAECRNIDSFVDPLPNFFLVGAPKAGTTALFTYLAQHPQIYTSPIHAPSYFADEVRPENLGEELLRDYHRGVPERSSKLVLDWGGYLDLFRQVRNETAIGETSPIYLWSGTAPRNIAAAIPNAKILMILRDPADRAFSEYLNYLTVGAVSHSFTRQIQRALRPRDRKMGKDYPFLEFGLYYQQVSRYFEYFPRHRVHILFYQDYQREPRQSVSAILEFLGVDPNLPIDQARKHNQPRVPRLRTTGYCLKRLGIWHRARRLLPEPAARFLRPLALAERKSLVMERKDRELLVAYYRDDIAKLSALLNRDLSSWSR